MVVDWHIRSKYAISSTTHYYQFSSRTTQLDYNSCMKSKKPLSTTAAVCLQKKNFHFGWKCISSRFRWMLKFYWNGNKCQDLTLFNQFPCQHKTYTFLAGWYSFLGLFLMFEKRVNGKYWIFVTGTAMRRRAKSLCNLLFALRKEFEDSTEFLSIL